LGEAYSKGVEKDAEQRFREKGLCDFPRPENNKPLVQTENS